MNKKQPWDSSYDIRKSRVQIKYETETEEGLEEKELPFVVGVLGDFSGNNSSIKIPLSERNFININSDNFNRVMKEINPGLKLKVKNTMDASTNLLSIDLTFNKMEDFSPDFLIDQIEPLRKLKEARNRLRELLIKSEKFPEIEEWLEKELSSLSVLKKETALPEEGK